MISYSVRKQAKSKPGTAGLLRGRKTIDHRAGLVSRLATGRTVAGEGASSLSPRFYCSGGAAAARQPHKLEVKGASPFPATSFDVQCVTSLAYQTGRPLVPASAGRFLEGVTSGANATARPSLSGGGGVGLAVSHFEGKPSVPTGGLQSRSIPARRLNFVCIIFVPSPLVSMSLLTGNIAKVRLRMSQIPFEDGKVTAGVLQMHRAMVAREARGPGDIENAMRRLESKYGLDFWTQWGLRYRPPDEIKDRSLIERIRQGYLDMIARSVRRDLQALKAEQAKGADDNALAGLITEAESLLEKLQEKRPLIPAG